MTDDTPVALLIHGGGWAHMDRYSITGIAEWMQRDLGFAVYNVGYRLATSDHPWPACGVDCVDAAKFVLGGGVTLGEGAVVYPGSVVVPRRTIGAGAVVGAGSTVFLDVEPGVTVLGNPAAPLE